MTALSKINFYYQLFVMSERISIKNLQEYLDLPNQNDRQCAVQDVIDAKAYDLIPAVAKTSFAPVITASSGLVVVVSTLAVI